MKARIAFAALALALAAGAAAAQDKYPSKTVTVIVPQAPGGANDTIARIVAQKLTEQLGQQFIVDNKPGAGGNVGTAAAARASGGTLRRRTAKKGSRRCPSPSLYPKISKRSARWSSTPPSVVVSVFAGTISNPARPRIRPSARRNGVVGTRSRPRSSRAWSS